MKSGDKNVKREVAQIIARMDQNWAEVEGRFFKLMEQPQDEDMTKRLGLLCISLVKLEIMHRQAIRILEGTDEEGRA